MNQIFKTHIESIRELCRQYQISKLWVFGSVLSTRFRKDSDIDFLYELNHQKLPGDISIDYFLTFVDKAEAILNHPVQMV